MPTGSHRKAGFSPRMKWHNFRDSKIWSSIRRFQKQSRGKWLAMLWVFLSWSGYWNMPFKQLTSCECYWIINDNDDSDGGMSFVIKLRYLAYNSSQECHDEDAAVGCDMMSWWMIVMKACERLWKCSVCCMDVTVTFSLSIWKVPAVIVLIAVDQA